VRPRTGGASALAAARQVKALVDRFGGDTVRGFVDPFG